MQINRMLLSLACLALASMPGTILRAQESQSSNPLQSGPAVPGVCLLSREAIFANAKVGKAASVRLKQLADQVQSQVEAERKPITSDVQAYRAQAASLPADQRQSREQALAQRMQKVQEDQAVHERELEATRVKAMGQIAQYAQPVIGDAYRAKNCGLLLDRNAVLGGNMANDLTPAVVQGLDAKVSTITFDLEKLPAAAAPSR